MMPRPTHLKLERDLPRVLALREGAPSYVALIEDFRSRVQGRRVIVFGSAPGMIPPACLPDDITICVNGSFDNATRAGVQVSQASPRNPVTATSIDRRGDTTNWPTSSSSDFAPNAACRCRAPLRPLPTPVGCRSQAQADQGSGVPTVTQPSSDGDAVRTDR